MSGFQFDWKIPIASIAAAGMVVMGSLWTVAQREQLIADHEKRVTRLETTMETVNHALAPLPDRERRLVQLENGREESIRNLEELRRQAAVMDQRLIFLVERLGQTRDPTFQGRAK